MASISRLPSGHVTITTNRLVLRGAVESDAAPMFKALSDPDVMRYWSECPHPSLARTVQWISNMTAVPQNGVTDFIMCMQPGASTPIGKIGVWQGDEIGFLLRKDCWGQGLAREAMNALLPYYFGSAQEGGSELEKITADVDPRNEASLGFLKAFGFEEVGFAEKTFEIAGEWVDSTYLTLKKEMWVERNKPGLETRKQDSPEAGDGSR